MLSEEEVLFLIKRQEQDTRIANMAAYVECVVVNELLESDDEDMDMDIVPFLIGMSVKSTAPKIFGFVDLILHSYSPADFKSDFRLSRETFESLLTELRPVIAFPNREIGRPPLEPEHQLLIYVWYLSNQDSMREIARIFGVTKFAVHRCVRRVSKAVCSLKTKMIVWPDEEMQRETARRIHERQVPDVIGFIDGTHIRLSHIPGGDNGYINRKGYPSIQLQIIVNDQMRIIDAYVGWPGSVHDARVYRNSPVYSDLQHERLHLGADRYLIGDAAYPLSSFMMTPFRDTGHLTAAQKIYNKKVSSVRQTVERSIGHLKMQFRRLRDLNCMGIRSCCFIIMSACVLHNLCVISGDELLEYINPVEVDVRVNNYPAVYRDATTGIHRRNRLVEYFRNCYM